MDVYEVTLGLLALQLQDWSIAMQMVLESIGEQASTALFFASTSFLTLCHLQAANILKKRWASTEQK